MDNSNQVFKRNELYWGQEAQKNLKNKTVAIFGLGGVGSYAADAIARSGVENFILVDFDKVDITNINRQLIALQSNVGKKKTDLMKERILDINPDAKVNCISDFYTEKMNEKLFEVQKPDFVLDAIDTLKYKIELIDTCIKKDIPIISSMGAGNRVDPTKLYIADISEVKAGGCSFLKNVKSKLKSVGITEGLTVVTSNEKPFNTEKISNEEIITTESGEEIHMLKFTPASTPFVPPAAGYAMASWVVREMVK